MNILRSVNRPLSWPAALLFIGGAVACFHAAYSPSDFGPLRLGIFGYVVFLTQLARLKTTRRSFYAGLLTGLMCIAPQLICFWKIFGPGAMVLWLILALWIGAFTGISHAARERFGATRAAMLVPFVWLGLEYFRSELYYLKFSWLNVGYAFAQGQMFPFHWLGMYGIGFLAAICGALFFVLRTSYAALVSALVLIVCALPGRISNGEKSYPQICVAGVQMEFPSEREIPAALDQLLAAHTNADILVLSEYTLDGPVPPALKDWCRTHHRYLVVGGKDKAPNENFYDSAFVVGPEGEIVFRQVKSVPIQFFKDGLPAPEQEVWKSPWGKIGFCVCYDLSYTRVIDGLVKKGAQLIIVPTMDVSDWGLRQHQLHALVAPVRAAEYGIPIFRLASSGISQAVAADGRVLATAPFLGEGQGLSAILDLPPGGSLPWDRFVAPVAVGITGLLVLLLWFGKSKSKTNPVASGEGNAEVGKDPAETIQLRVYGDDSKPTLIYLPGLHGDWTLIGSFRRALGNRVRFVEVTYPRTLTWSLEDYAANVERALAEKGITRGWLLGESFSSVVVWPMIERRKFHAEGLILAGGFVQHSMRWGARLVQRVAGAMPLSLLTAIMFGYAKVARIRYRRSPETRADIQEFIARRTESDKQAAVHRLQLVAESDPRGIAKNASLPVFALTGALDPIVPWVFVRTWLRGNCPALREYKIIWRADHNVLSTAPDASADKVMQWIHSTRNAEVGAMSEKAASSLGRDVH